MSSPQRQSAWMRWYMANPVTWTAGDRMQCIVIVAGMTLAVEHFIGWFW